MTDERCIPKMSDSLLLDEFARLVEQDQRHTASLLRYIDAIDRRKLWAKMGHPSMFDFCVVRFHMSESTAGKRIGAARSARRFPVLFDMVARGEIHLSGIHRLKAHLTPENHRHVLGRAKHKTIKQIEHLVAELAPKPELPSSLRRLPAPRTLTQTSHPQATVSQSPPALEPEPPPPARRAPPPAPELRSPDPQPLAASRYKLQVTLDQTAHEHLRQLQDLLAHQIPNGDPAAIVRRALALLLADTQKKKFAQTDRLHTAKRANPNKQRSRNIPANLRRQVWQRDQGRCSFIGNDGHRCNETRALEFAHALAWGKGGGHSLENLALRCHAHNLFEAERDYGAGFIAGKRVRSDGAFRVRESTVVRYPGARTLFESFRVTRPVYPTRYSPAPEKSGISTAGA